jgi:hypothetical protein
MQKIENTSMYHHEEVVVYIQQIEKEIRDYLSIINHIQAALRISQDNRSYNLLSSGRNGLSASSQQQDIQFTIPSGGVCPLGFKASNS